MDQTEQAQPFQRQVKIEGWKQDRIQESIVLVLGVGGIGSIVLIDLLRVGVKKVIIVDYDKVEIHNVNRQLAYSLKDVGAQKVAAAKKNSEFFNVGGTVVEEYDMDALENWGKIVQLAKECNVIFNCIDHGDSWDAAVQSLCLSLNIPHLIGGSYAQSLVSEIYVGKPCYVCLDDMPKVEILQQITPDKIQSLENLNFLPKNEKPEGQSHIALCSTSGNFVTQLFLNYLNEEEGARQTKKLIFYMTTYESVVFPLESNPKCLLCGGGEPEQESEGSKPQIEQLDQVSTDIKTEAAQEQNAGVQAEAQSEQSNVQDQLSAGENKEQEQK